MRRPRLGRSSIRDADVAALVVPLPAVERALQDLAHDVAAVTRGGRRGARSRRPSRSAGPTARATRPSPGRSTSSGARRRRSISSDQATWNHPVGFIDSGGLAMGRNHRAFNVNPVNPRALRRFRPGASRVVMQGPTIRGDGDDESGAVDRCRPRRSAGIVAVGACSTGEKVDLGDDASGRLVAAIAGEPDQLDPHKTSAYFSFEVLENVFDTLVEPDDEPRDAARAGRVVGRQRPINSPGPFICARASRSTTAARSPPTTSSTPTAASSTKKLANADKFSAVTDVSATDPATVVIARQAAHPEPADQPRRLQGHGDRAAQERRERPDRHPPGRHRPVRVRRPEERGLDHARRPTPTTGAAPRRFRA